jgi:hypothetical protein
MKGKLQGSVKMGDAWEKSVLELIRKDRWMRPPWLWMYDYLIQAWISSVHYAVTGHMVVIHGYHSLNEQASLSIKY